MSSFFKKKLCLIYLCLFQDVSSRDTISTKCNQLYTLKPNCELFASPSCTQVLSAGIPCPYMLIMQLRLTLLNLYIYNENAKMAITLLVLLLPVGCCILY